MVEIERLTEAKESYLSDITKLLSQLRSNPSEHNGKLSELQAMVVDPSIFIVVAKDGEKIVGIGSLYTIVKVGKASGTIEDVVVDGEYRGQGLGEKLTQKLIDMARDQNIHHLYLTSTPDRIPAHRLYEKLGFKRRDTFVFKLVL